MCKLGHLRSHTLVLRRWVSGSIIVLCFHFFHSIQNVLCSFLLSVAQSWLLLCSWRVLSGRYRSRIIRYFFIPWESLYHLFLSLPVCGWEFPFLWLNTRTFGRVPIIRFVTSSRTVVWLVVVRMRGNYWTYRGLIFGFSGNWRCFYVRSRFQKVVSALKTSCVRKAAISSIIFDLASSLEKILPNHISSNFVSKTSFAWIIASNWRSLLATTCTATISAISRWV